MLWNGTGTVDMSAVLFISFSLTSWGSPLDLHGSGFGESSCSNTDSTRLLPRHIHVWLRSTSHVGPGLTLAWLLLSVGLFQVPLPMTSVCSAKAYPGLLQLSPFQALWQNFWLVHYWLLIRLQLRVGTAAGFSCFIKNVPAPIPRPCLSPLASFCWPSWRNSPLANRTSLAHVGGDAWGDDSIPGKKDVDFSSSYPKH